ncbi:MAG TPA: peptidoglycan DD-metalloendopeptidase family protein [Candidatus Limnocylindrales bacterium]|jgi:murein DD-endopeptidase MepM/ murein hydrolase activator NlpD
MRRREQNRSLRHRIRRFPVFLLAALVIGLVGSAPAVTGDELADALARQKALAQLLRRQKEEVAALNVAQAQLRGQIASTKGSLLEINADLRVVRRQVTGMVLKVEQVQETYDDLVMELGDLDTQMMRLTNAEAAKTVQLAQRKEMLADRIRQAYDADRTSMLETVLSAGSFTDALAEVGYQLDVAHEDRMLAEQIMRDQEVLAAIHETVTLTRAETDRLRIETAAQKVELDARLVELRQAQQALRVLEKRTQGILAEQKASYARLAANKSALSAAMGRARAAKASIASKIDTLIEQQRQRGNIPSEYNGTLKWPMSGTISGEFGCSPFPYYGPGHGCEHFHNGIDIVAPYGTPVRAAGDGRVAYIGWNYADGYDPAWIVVIAHAENLQTWYAHMQPRYPGGISAGSPVHQGQIIGYEGNTGNSTGAHLHWMVELNGDFENPRLFL